jgi:hypothetical protein
MLRIYVTNEAPEAHTWFVEPYGDQVVLAESQVLEIEVDHGPDVALRIDLRAVVWTEVNGDVMVPSDLKHNGVRLWPPA